MARSIRIAVSLAFLVALLTGVLAAPLVAANSSPPDQLRCRIVKRTARHLFLTHAHPRLSLVIGRGQHGVTLPGARRFTVVSVTHKYVLLRASAKAPTGVSVTAPTGSGSYSVGASLTVRWTTNRAASSGEFCVWARSSSGSRYIGRLVPASGGSSFSTAVTLSVPAGAGYRAVVSYRPTAGGGAWSLTATSPGSFAVVAPTPAATVMLGAFSQYQGQSSAQSIQQLESQLGRSLRIDSHYYDWTDSFPGGAEDLDAANGRTPMITWWGTHYASIVDGSQDALIRARAAAIKAFGKPVFLRWGAEMNGDWFTWSGRQNGNDPSGFVAAWRHIHDVFAAAGVSNASWVWAPNADSHPGGTDLTSWNNWTNYYPGDQYVDWVGIDGYNWGGAQWQSFGSVVGPVYDSYAGRKPIMIAETGSVENGGDKAAWITAAQLWMKSHGAVRAFVYFDTDQSSSGIDWRIQTSPESLSSFKTLAADPYFGG